MSIGFSFCFKYLLQPAQNVLPEFASLHGALRLVSPQVLGTVSVTGNQVV